MRAVHLIVLFASLFLALPGATASGKGGTSSKESDYGSAGENPVTGECTNAMLDGASATLEGMGFSTLPMILADESTSQVSLADYIDRQDEFGGCWSVLIFFTDTIEANEYLHPGESSDMTETSTAKELAAGSVGGVMKVLTGQPFDIVKVRLQTTTGSARTIVRDLVRIEGLRAFYRGTKAPLVGVGACVSLQFAGLQNAKEFFKTPGKPLTSLELFMSGAFGGVLSSALGGPIEHIRCRLQIQTTENTGMVALLRSIIQNHGLSAVFKGQSATILREAVGYGFYFTTYETLVANEMQANQITDRSGVSPLKQALFGVAAGYAMWGTTYPIDAIKSKLQTDFLVASERKYHSIADCIVKTWKSGGIRAFYRGFLPCMIRAAPVNAGTFLGYETAIRIINKYNQGRDSLNNAKGTRKRAIPDSFERQSRPGVMLRES